MHNIKNRKEIYMSKTQVNEIDRNIYDIKNKDDYEFKMQKGLSRETMVNTEEETSFDIFEENDFQTDAENEDSSNEDDSDTDLPITELFIAYCI